MVKKSIIQIKSFEFALGVIQLYKLLQGKHEYVLSKQLLRCGTSVGANVEEGSAGQSRRDFLSKMSIASKEARETVYWLRLLQASKLADLNVDDHLLKAEELVKILSAIVKTTEKHLYQETKN